MEGGSVLFNFFFSFKMSVLKCQPILLNRHFFFKEWGQRGIRESQGQSERSQRGVRGGSEGGQRGVKGIKESHCWYLERGQQVNRTIQSAGQKTEQCLASHGFYSCHVNT